ncbi:MAG TPA: tetratricopeptide repeat protein [Atribacter sp.]|uniref:Lipoprotein NlpI n=1 Tax=Candidatus Atribacter allofermentans TaxID=1852833 RepID=A0A1V5T3S8_9BACT|nr:GerW family sporulation protein [Atribacter sp.]MDD3714182.1 tetratricopeptide repeat protein [Atribacterota bacterium]OQA61183.1 MAG: lipoprotein NlpI [Candidatus Atribacteria bacterium ADurb.Bin276]HQK83765.1 tetratricopeptide repeat protein [Atribacter sp.]
MKKIVFMVILIWLVMSLSVWAVESIDSEITRITSALKGEYTLGKPVIIGELTIIPVVKTNVLSFGSDKNSSFQMIFGGISLEPVAILVVKDGIFQIYNIGEPDAGVGEIFETIPGLLPQTQTLSENAKQELIKKGRESLQKKDFEKARQIFEDLLKNSPELADAHALLGQALGELAQSTADLNKKIQYGMEAFREFARALEIEPDNPYALVARGYARLMVPPPLGGVDMAIEDFNLVINKHPEFIDAYIGLAEAYSKKGDQEKAKEYFNKVLELDPENVQAKEGLSRLNE